MRPFTLVTSDDPLLLQRGVDRVLREFPSDVAVERTDVDEEGLPDVRTGSLFGDATLHVLRFGRVPAGGVLDELLSLAAGPGDTPVVVAVLHAARLPRTLQRLADEAGGGDAHVAVTTPPDWADEQWDRLVGEEFRFRGRHADASAVAALRRHAGLEPSAIAVQVATVCASATGDPTVALTEDDVDAVLEGHGRQSGFAVADAIVAHDAGAALAATRGALDAGDAPLGRSPTACGSCSCCAAAATAAPPPSAVARSPGGGSAPCNARRAAPSVPASSRGPWTGSRSWTVISRARTCRPSCCSRSPSSSSRPAPTSIRCVRRTTTAPSPPPRADWLHEGRGRVSRARRPASRHPSRWPCRDPRGRSW
jgi:DNA polymerase-3 subunit delta